MWCIGIEQIIGIQQVLKELAVSLAHFRVKDDDNL
jgi:hypothetical protein